MTHFIHLCSRAHTRHKEEVKLTNEMWTGQETRTMIILQWNTSFFSLGYLSHLNNTRMTTGHDTWRAFDSTLLRICCGLSTHCAIDIKNPSAGNYHCPARFSLLRQCVWIWWLSNSELLLCLLCNCVATRQRGTLESVKTSLGIQLNLSESQTHNRIQSSTRVWKPPATSHQGFFSTQIRH